MVTQGEKIVALETTIPFLQTNIQQLNEKIDENHNETKLLITGLTEKIDGLSNNNNNGRRKDDEKRGFLETIGYIYRLGFMKPIFYAISVVIVGYIIQLFSTQWNAGSQTIKQVIPDKATQQNK